MLFFAGMASLIGLISFRSLALATVIVALHHLALGAVVPAAVFPSSELIVNLARAVFHAVILVAEVAALSVVIFKRIEMDQSVAKKEAEVAHAHAEVSARAAEQTAVVVELQKGLSRLSAGDLTVRIDTPLVETFEPLRHDFNTAMEWMSDVLLKVQSDALTIRTRMSEADASTQHLSQRTQSQAATPSP